MVTRLKNNEEINSQELQYPTENYDEMDNNETVKELRENRYRLYQRKLMALKKDIQNATENSYSVIENNNNAFRSIKSPGSSANFVMG
jgi:hypothetical protein